MSNTTRATGGCHPRFGLLACLLVLVSAAPVRAQGSVEINSRRLGDRVLLTWGCDHFQGTNMTVVATSRGLVVIDTGLSPSTVQRQRELVERELGRGDFRYLINTHMHNDHAFGNEVFREATLVSHEDGVSALRQEVDRIPELLDRLRSSRESYSEWAAATSPDSVPGLHAREGVAAFLAGITDLEAGIEPVFPTVTFERHRTLTLGDVRLELYDFTGFHSDADILVLLPEERLLFTGDVFWGGQLPMLREMAPREFSRLMDNWRTIIDSAPDLDTIIPGHSDVPLTVEQFREMHGYFSRLWSDVQDARETGTPLMMFLMRNVFAGRYPEVADYNYTAREYNRHQHNIYMLWHLTGS